MALKDRIKKSSNIDEILEETSVTLEDVTMESFEIPVKTLTKKILKVQDNAKLGAILKEVAKFLSSLSDEGAHLTLDGNFDIGKKALINCLLMNVTGEASFEADKSEGVPKLLRKRKSLREKMQKSED